MIRLLFVLGGYLFGLIQAGYIYGKIVGVDLEKTGSGNTGATNALRVMGVRGAVVVWFFDMLKALIPCLLVRFLYPAETPNELYAMMMYVSLGVILGNDFPFYRSFKGGKGVAATSGWALAWYWPFALGGLAVFFVIAFLTGYASLASMAAAVLLFGSSFVFGAMKFVPNFDGFAWEFYAIFLILTILLILRHRGNIKKLLNGTENRFGHRK